jgi:glutamate synthase domain-containing protein 2/glutamate synthase domain-containing protein 1/glutamate synthase domain-containing protein 3
MGHISQNAVGCVASPGSTLLDSRFDHDSCGVGFVATLRNQPSHQILAQALTALARLAHRGAIAADGKSSDGVGIMTGIPRDFLLAASGLTLPTEKPLAVGVVFLPSDNSIAQHTLEQALAAQRLEVIAWRVVPTRLEVLGEIALSSIPVIRQVLITTSEPESLDRRLYLARKQFERAVAADSSAGYLCSLSSSCVVYKALCAGRLLAAFYPDLAAPAYVTRFALFHQRYATNVLPSWHRAQPFRMSAHNGEINTIWGNRARMEARAATIPAECYPLLTEDGSDSTSLDEIIELLARNGRSVAEAVRMMLPPAGRLEDSAFLRYHADCIEPWDGPAALAFADGHLVGVALDRNGLRPCRYFLTDDALVVAGSEAGLVDLDPERVIHSGRLGPGEMLVADLDAHQLLEDEQLLKDFDRFSKYAGLVADTRLEPSSLTPPVSNLAQLHQAFGYTREDVRMVLSPMASEGKDAVWSMGDDTPITPLARSPRPVYAFFRQRFAQVTNPAIDPLRESCVIQLRSRLGPWAHLLDTSSRIPGLSLQSPFLSLGQVHALRTGEHPLASELPLAVLDCVLPPASTLARTLDDLCARAVELVRGGAAILMLSDRAVAHSQPHPADFNGASPHRNGGSPEAKSELIPIPMALATGAVHRALVHAGVRTLTGLAVEAGDCRDLHHAAVLVGFGAGAVCPWLALETARSVHPEKGEANMIHAFELGLAKIMSKMGISVVSSYRGAHLFDALGLDQEVIDRCFEGTPSPIGGVGFTEIEAALREGWARWQEEALPALVNAASHSSGQLAGRPLASVPVAIPIAIEDKRLPDYGWFRFRKDNRAEPHGWQPQTVRALQLVTGTAHAASALDPTQAWALFRAQTVDAHPTVLRDLLEIRPAAAPLAIDQVEAPANIAHRFIASAMSLGSLSPEAHRTITAAMNTIGARSNTGEGGEDPADYAGHLPGTPALHNCKIKQVASARFGVTAEYLSHAEEIEIKIAQGSKPGEGGQLPSHKVTELIARLRHAQPGIALISPPPHHDIYSIEDLAQLIFDLKRVNPRAAIGVKLVSGCGVGTVAAGVAKAYADYIVIAGHAGGTGASPLSSIKHAGNPWELGLAEAQQVLIQNGLRGRVRLRCDGGLRTARDILIAALLGADEYAFGTAVLVALGCDMARQCHLNTCPTGIATQRPELRAKFRGKPEHLIRFFEELARDVQVLLASLGLHSLEAAVGRTDLLDQVRSAGGLDLSALVAPVFSGPVSWQGERNRRPDDHAAIDDEWIEPAIAARAAGLPFSLNSRITNADRTLGARLAGELVTRGLETPSSLTFNLQGVAGQSFGAFAIPGMQLILEGLANDFVGKGLCGGELILRGQGRAARQSELHVILGNVALYGATAGALFAAGRAGERFAVRNSGALAVVEGVGDHGCEYMTGGMVTVLGATGQNFGAGMTGGSAWVFDEDGQFLARAKYHADFLAPLTFDNVDIADREALRAIIQLHAEKTASTRAHWILSEWSRLSPRFVRLMPLPQA